MMARAGRVGRKNLRDFDHCQDFRGVLPRFDTPSKRVNFVVQRSRFALSIAHS